MTEQKAQQSKTRNRNVVARKGSYTPEITPLVTEAIEFINKHHDNSNIFACFQKKKNAIHTFGVYNSKTKKYSLWQVANFTPEAFVDLKEVTLAR